MSVCEYRADFGNTVASLRRFVAVTLSPSVQDLRSVTGTFCTVPRRQILPDMYRLYIRLVGKAGNGSKQTENVHCGLLITDMWTEKLYNCRGRKHL